MSTADYAAKYQKRKGWLEKIEKAWLDEAQRPAGALDSSLKKHTTLLNRLKSSLLIGPAETLIKEIDGLTLTKYLEEIVAAVVEGASRGKGDPDVAVEVIIHLHTRLTPDFLPQLLAPNTLLAVLSPPAPSASSIKDGGDKDKEKEEKDRLAKQRIALRIVAELAMAGAWEEGAARGGDEVVRILKGFMTNDPQFTNLPLLTYFLKHLGRVYMGSMGEATSNDEAAEPMEELAPKAIQTSVRDLFLGYFSNASKTLVKGQIKLLEQDKRNHEAYIKSGEIFEDRQHAYERMTKAVERLTTGVQTLADLLGQQAPILPTAASLSKSGLQIVESQSSFTVRDEGEGGGIWDDDEERRFYEDLLDLKQVVPASLLGIKEKSHDQETSAAAEEEKRKKDEEDIRRQLEQMDLQDESGKQANGHDDTVEMSRRESTGSEDAIARIEVEKVADAAVDSQAPAIKDKEGDEELQSGPVARLNAIFATLPEASNREMVDKLATDFAFLNSKAARKRLITFIGSVPKNRTDLLPHYGRLLATLDPYMSDVSAGVLELLDEEMRYLQRKRLIRELDGVRLKNVRFWGELAKFKVAKPYAILHVLKVFLDDFRANIENIANLLETCGKFLLRNEPTAATAKNMIELMRRKQANSHLDQRHLIMLENAFYQCNPPERVARQVVELPPMQQFIQYLLYHVLEKKTIDKVLKLLRKLHWDDESTYNFILTTFTDIWEIKYGNIEHAAALVDDLARYHPDFSVAVIDQVLEDIRLGMEENIFKYNQRRIASVKYLGELYMYRVVNAPVIFDTLWSLISFGHREQYPVPGRDSPIDAVHDFFRVRLVCTLLDTCGSCFSKGSLKRKMDHFLVFFQLYIVCKIETPMDVEFMLTDTFEALRPKDARLRTFAEAAAAVDEILAAEGDADEVATEGSDTDDEEGDGHVPRAHGSAPTSPAQPTAPLSPDEDDGDSTPDEGEDVILLRDPHEREEVDLEAQADFDREFAKMLVDPSLAVRGKAPPVFDAAVPHIRKTESLGPSTAAKPTFSSAPARAAPTNGENGMQFTFLAKKGGKQQLRPLEVPMDSTIAMNIRSHQLRSKAEQEQLKRLVLQNERRQGMSEVQALEQQRGGIKWRFNPG